MLPIRRCLPLLGALITAALVAPAAAPAASAIVKGQVVGSPYVADATRTAVPVLLSKETARGAKLKSPLGVVIMPRRTAVPTPSGSVLPGRLRLGDRFTGRITITKEARAATYPRLAIKRTRVTKRSKQLSTQELEEELARTRKNLAGLATYVNQLAAYVGAGFADVNGRVTTLTTQLGAVRTDVATLSGRVDKLALDLAAAAKDLRDRIDLVRSDLQPQITAVADQLAALSAQLGACGTAGTVLNRICVLETALAGLSPTDLGPLTDRVTQISSALTTLVNQLTGLTLTGDLPAALTNQITTLLSNLTGLSGTVAGLTGQVGTLNTTVSSLSAGLTSVTGLVGGVDVGALNTTVSGLTGQVGNLIATLGTDPSGLNSTTISTLQTALTGAQTQVSGILAYLSPGDSNLATTADNTLNQATATLAGLTGTTIPAIQGQLATVCTTWRTTLSGVSLPVLNLLAVLTGSTTLPTLPSC